MNKARIICEKTQEIWMEPILRSALSGIYETEIQKDAEWDRNDLIILAGEWSEVGSGDLLSRLITQTAQGGSLLIVGNGLLAQNCHEIKLLSGMSPLRELPWGQIAVHRKDVSLAECLEDSEIWDLPVFFSQDVFDRSEIIAGFSYGKRKYPLAWHKDWCRGHVYCLAMGRTKPSLLSFARLIRAFGADAAERGRPN